MKQYFWTNHQAASLSISAPVGPPDMAKIKVVYQCVCFLCVLIIFYKKMFSLELTVGFYWQLCLTDYLMQLQWGSQRMVS